MNSNGLRRTERRLQAVLTDSRGTRIRPGDHKGGSEDAVSVSIVVSSVWAVLNDLLGDVSGHLNAVARMLKIDRENIHNPGEWPSQSDVDTTTDSAFKAIKYQAEKSLRLIRDLNESDVSLRDGRRMLAQFLKALRAVKPHVDSAPGIYIAQQWLHCCYVLITPRSSDVARQASIERWEAAKLECARLIG